MLYSSNLSTVCSVYSVKSREYSSFFFLLLFFLILHEIYFGIRMEICCTAFVYYVF